MIKTDDYLEPLKYYEHYLKDAHNENVTALFDELTKESKVDIENNKITVRKYHAESKALEKFRSKLGGVKFLIGLFIFLFIGGLIGGIALLVMGGSQGNGIMIGVGAGLLALAVSSLLIWLLVFKNKKKDLEAKVNDKQNTVNKLKDECIAQMAPLNSLFTPDMPINLIKKTAPLFEFDSYLKDEELERIVNQYEYPLDTDATHSTLVVQSGKLNNNPFLLRQVYEMKMVDQIYTGHLVITYTRTVSDGNGGTRRVTVTQTLTATITKPKPSYGVSTYLQYFTDAAPKLSFSRSPAGLVGKSEKEVQRIIDKKDKEESKKAEKALKKGISYTKFANSKFESYFNPSGRDNDLEYRLLFTPLAQTNYIYNYSKGSLFGDDVYFSKNKMVNTVMSTHDMGFDYSGDGSNYYDFDYEEIKDKFISYNNNYFASFYADFLPLLSIPLYHQHRSPDYIAPRNRKENISYYEAEVLINKFDPSLFKPEKCDTNIILKPTIMDHQIKVTAVGFTAIPKVEFVPVMGGDGMMHPVPVNYFEYQPVAGNKVVNLAGNDSKNLDYNSESVINYRMFKGQVI